MLGFFSHQHFSFQNVLEHHLTCTMGWAAKMKAKNNPAWAKHKMAVSRKRKIEKEKMQMEEEDENKGMSRSELKLKNIRMDREWVPISKIKNKFKRRTLWQERKYQITRIRRRGYQKRKNLRKKYGFQAAPYKIVHQEDKRIPDPQIVEAGDEEVEGDHAMDEFSKHYSNSVQPRTLLTTSMKPLKKTVEFINELLDVFPDAKYFTRRTFTIKSIIMQVSLPTPPLLIWTDKSEFILLRRFGSSILQSLWCTMIRMTTDHVDGVVDHTNYFTSLYPMDPLHFID